MVYDIYNYNIHGVYNQLITGGPTLHISLGCFLAPIGDHWRPSCFLPKRILPSGYVKIAIENTTFIVDLPIQNGDFP